MKGHDETTVSFMPSSPNWLSTAEAATYLGITPRTLYRFIDEGQITGYRFGRVIRLRVEDVDGFIAANRIAPGTLEHLYPELVGGSKAGVGNRDDDRTSDDGSSRGSGGGKAQAGT